MAEVITDPNLREFVHSKVSKSFGLSVDTVANKCKNWGRFKSWLSSDVNRIKKVLNIVKNNGVSPAFFASYEKTEGYNSKWGWLNHTSIKGSPEEDADNVSKWIVSQSNNTTDNPAWIDYANYKDFVPADIKTAGNADFKNMSKGSIGKVIIAGTAAATWEVYYPNGLKKEYNGVQNYGAPINAMMNSIIEWGGNMENDNPDPDPIPDPNPDPDPEPDPPALDFSGIDKFFTGFSESLIKQIESMMNINLYDYGESRTFGNSFIKVDEIFSNMYKLKPTLNFGKTVDDLIDKANGELKDIIGNLTPSPPDPEPEPEPDPEPTPDPDPDEEMFFPVDYTGTGINFWYPPYTKGSVQESMDFGGPRSGGRIHAGYDIGAGGIKGNKVYSIRTGKVTFVGNDGVRGFVIRIKHSSDDKHVMYMHLVVNSNKVKVGDNVKAGQEIGTMGDTPNGMYSIHLHVEVDTTGQFNGYQYQDNPREYLKVTGNNKTSLKNPG